MNIQPVRVAQYGIGPIGAEIARLLLTKPWVKLVAAIDKLPRVDAFELNISCPNVSHGTDHAVDPASTEKVCRLAKKATSTPIVVATRPKDAPAGAMA